MQSLHASFSSDGPIVDVLVGLGRPALQALRNAGRPIPPPVLVRALVDIGADATCIDPQPIASLVAAGLQHVRFVFTNLPALGPSAFAIEYAVSLTVVHPSGDARKNFALHNHPIIEQRLGAIGYQALLGRDALERCILVYDGPAHTIILGY